MKQSLCSIISLFLLLTCEFVYSQSSAELLNKKLTVEPGSYKLEKVVELINSSNSMIIAYNSQNISPESLITVTRKNPSIQQLLDDIRKSIPVTYIIRKNYIILKYIQQSNNQVIKGIVTDKSTNAPLFGAYIMINNSTGAISKEDGTFQLTLGSDEKELKISYIGYKTEVISLFTIDSNFLEIKLEPVNKAISEIKVTSKLRKFYNLDIGRPLEAINAKAIENTNLNNVSDVLNGRFAGVWATQTSGMPGDHQRVHIRGISSLFGSVDPLYVIDGVSVPTVNLNTLGISDLNAYDIENITILKDASSSALFGFQGGNGVILIDTKQGGKEKEITFYTKQGIEWFPGRYDLMNTNDFLASMDSSKKKIGVDIRRFYPANSSDLANTDWQDRIFQTGKMSEYQLSASGNLKDVYYHISGNYLKNTGIIRNSSYTRYTVAANLEKVIFKKLTVNIGYRGCIQKNKNNLDGYGGNRIIFEGINKSPCQLSTPDSLYYFDDFMGNFAHRTYQEYNDLNSSRVIDSVIDKTVKTLDVMTNMFRGTLKYELTPHLYLKFSSDVTFREYNYLTNIRLDNKRLWGLYIHSTGSSLRRNYIKSSENIIVINNALNMKWERKFEDHSFSFLSGVKFYKDLVYWSDSVGNNRGSSSYSDNTINLSDDAYIRNSMSLHGPSGNVYRHLNSVLGNLNYNFQEKYFISLAGNYEQLKEGLDLNKKKLFPSVALSWDIAREKIFNSQALLNHLKVYSSWGVAGNYPLNGLSKDIYSNETSVIWNNDTNSGKYIDHLANHQLKQEIVEEYNIGANIDLFKESRLIASFDFFHKLNRNLIILRDIPGYYGGGKMFYNVGEIETKGKELTIEAFPVLTDNFTWYSKFNISTYSQKVNKLAVDSMLKIINTEDILYPSFIIKQNSGLGDIYGYKYDGKWTREDELKKNKVLQYANNRGIKYLNADSTNKTIDVNDMVVIGNSMPKFVLNWENSFSYKTISLNMLWYAVVGVDKYNATRAATYVAATNREINVFIYDSIKGIASPSLNSPNSSAPKYPGIFYQSSYFVEDASFIRLKQLVITYEPSKKIYDKIGLKLSLIVENLITLTHYKGYDPEATIYTDNNFSDNSIDRGAYPNPKAIFISATLKF